MVRTNDSGPHALVEPLVLDHVVASGIAMPLNCHRRRRVALPGQVDGRWIKRLRSLLRSGLGDPGSHTGERQACGPDDYDPRYS
ncbi:MAG: hypothetical protein V3U41_09425 [candidate division NC10 bacterium]